MDVRRLRVSELKEELGRRGLDTRGLKAELAGRLHAALEAEQARGAPGLGSGGEPLSDGHCKRAGRGKAAAAALAGEDGSQAGAREETPRAGEDGSAGRRLWWPGNMGCGKARSLAGEGGPYEADGRWGGWARQEASLAGEDGSSRGTLGRGQEDSRSLERMGLWGSLWPGSMGRARQPLAGEDGVVRRRGGGWVSGAGGGNVGAGEYGQ